MKMKIIGHRGAAGLALENTMAAFRAGIEAGVDGIELDVRLTKDKHLIVCHDASFNKVSGDARLIRDLDLAETRSIALNNGEHPPELADVLKLAGKVPVMVEIKNQGSVRHLLKVLDEFPDAKVTVISLKHHEIALVKSLRPGMPAYVATLTSPYDIILVARAIEADGIVINFWILNPFTYFMARRANLDIVAFTINNLFFAHFIHFFYPRVIIETNNPHFFKRPRKIAST